MPLPLPNPVPDVNLANEALQPPVTRNPTPLTASYVSEFLNEPRKKEICKTDMPKQKVHPISAYLATKITQDVAKTLPHMKYILF